MNAKQIDLLEKIQTLEFRIKELEELFEEIDKLLKIILGKDYEDQLEESYRIPDGNIPW